MKNRWISMLLVLLFLLSACSVQGRIRSGGAQRIAAELRRAAGLKKLCVIPDGEAVEVYGQDDVQLLAGFYGLQEGDCAEICVYLAQYAMDVTELAVFTCENENELRRAKLAVSQRLAAQMERFRAIPALYARLADARYGVCGKYYYFIVAEEKAADAAEKQMLEYK